MTTQGKLRLLYSYRTVFTCFAAWLTEEELKEVSTKPGFIRSFDNNPTNGPATAAKG
jgi:hypothetical protein